MVNRLFGEKQLVYRVQAKKDPNAFALLYDLYIQKIYRFVFLKLSNKEEAEDTTSEVFLKAWNYLIDESHGDIQSFSGLIYKIARNAVIDVYRKRSQKQEFSLEFGEHLEASTSAIDEIHASHDTTELLSKLKTLKTEYQEVIVFRYIDELSIAEIGQILGKKQVAVRVTLHRAMKILKSMIDPHE